MHKADLDLGVATVAIKHLHMARQSPKSCSNSKVAECYGSRNNTAQYLGSYQSRQCMRTLFTPSYILKAIAAFRTVISW